MNKIQFVSLILIIVFVSGFVYTSYENLKAVNKMNDLYEQAIEICQTEDNFESMCSLCYMGIDFKIFR